tara:strand:- start:6652 stop:6843 length:192 start_codon:yes stop_codon:yes gene_type:complete
MLLSDYIKNSGLTISKFAEKCNIPFPTMETYYYGSKIPRLENMLKIYSKTDKKVTANDFYGIK